MNKLFFVGILLSIVSTSTWSKEWYEGGTLHRESIQTWINSDYQNRLATAGDLFLTISKKENPKLLDVTATKFVQQMRLYAVELEKCITLVGNNKNASGGFNVAELAVICYMQMYKNK